MKKTALALIAACFGCCALAFVLPGLAGFTVQGLPAGLGVSLETLLCLLPVAALVALGLYALLRRRPCPTGGKCAADKSCGCT